MNRMQLEYIHEIVSELAELAESEKTATLAYILRVAEAESNLLLRQLAARKLPAKKLPQKKLSPKKLPPKKPSLKSRRVQQSPPLR